MTPTPAPPTSTAEAAHEYRRALTENYRLARQGGQQPPLEARRRPAEAELPVALRDLIQRMRTERPRRRFELLKYRHTDNERVVTELDDGEPLPSEERLMVASVTTSVVIGDQVTVEVHMVIGAWQDIGR